MRVLFLDIDGVLNNHYRHPNGFCGIDPEKMYILNDVLRRTQASVIVHSAWRYLMLGGWYNSPKPSMTIQGFYHMLQTYGFDGHIIGHLEEDNEEQCRATLLLDYINKYLTHEDSYVIVDDLELVLPTDRFVRTDGKIGLTQENANQIIRLFNEQDNPRKTVKKVRSAS